MSKTFACDDLNAAANISARGCRLISTEQSGTRTTFYFSDEDGSATAASIGFINNDLVKVRDFVSAYRELRSVAFAARRSQ